MKHDIEHQPANINVRDSISNDLLEENSKEDEMLRWKLAESDMPALPMYGQSNEMSRLVAEQSESKTVSKEHRFISS